MTNLANCDSGLGLVTNIVIAISLAALGNAIIYSVATEVFCHAPSPN